MRLSGGGRRDRVASGRDRARRPDRKNHVGQESCRRYLDVSRHVWPGVVRVRWSCDASARQFEPRFCSARDATARSGEHRREGVPRSGERAAARPARGCMLGNE